MLVVALTTWGLSVVGTTFSAMTVGLRLRELMLPMLIYPIMIPCLLGRSSLPQRWRGRKPIEGELVLGLRLIVGFDVIYTALASVLVETVLMG